mgnify:CR=1 FL=1
MKEDFKYQIIKKLVELNGNKKAAALRIGCTVRHLNRMIRGYRSNGKEFFIHGNKGIKPIHTISEDIRCMIIDLYKTKYHEANFTHYAELLDTHEGIAYALNPNTISLLILIVILLILEKVHPLWLLKLLMVNITLA